MRGCRLWLGSGYGESVFVRMGMWIMHEREDF